MPQESGKFKFLSDYITHRKLSKILRFRKAFSSQIACELVHLALGSSTGTWNDTWVSALIRIFMMKFGVTSLATKRTWKTLRMTMRRTPRMMMAVTQNYFSDNGKCLPLNLVKDSSVQWKVFARLENPLRDTSPINSEWDFSLLSSAFSRKSQLIIWACVLLFLIHCQLKPQIDFLAIVPSTETGFHLFSSVSREILWHLMFSA